MSLSLAPTLIAAFLILISTFGINIITLDHVQDIKDAVTHIDSDPVVTMYAKSTWMTAPDQNGSFFRLDFNDDGSVTDTVGVFGIHVQYTVPKKYISGSEGLFGTTLTMDTFGTLSQKLGEGSGYLYVNARFYIPNNKKIVALDYNTATAEEWSQMAIKSYTVMYYETQEKALQSYDTLQRLHFVDAITLDSSTASVMFSYKSHIVSHAPVINDAITVQQSQMERA